MIAFNDDGKLEILGETPMLDSVVGEISENIFEAILPEITSKTLENSKLSFEKGRYGEKCQTVKI